MKKDSKTKLFLKNYLNQTYFIPTRIFAIKELFYNKIILKKTLKYFLRGNFSLSSYFASLIECIEPKIIITTCDNSHHFFKTAKLLHKKFKFIAIQRSTRDAIIKLPEKLKKIIFIPEYFCFGNYEKNFYKKCNAHVKKFSPVGSYHFSNFEDKFKYKKFKKIYDICLIAEIPYEHSFDYNAEGVKLAKFVKKFSKKFKLKAVVAGKRRRLSPERYKLLLNESSKARNTQEIEIATYSKIFGKRNYVYNTEGQYSSYMTALQSKVTVGMSSTMLREVMAKGEKILVWNSRQHYNKRIKFPINGICSISCNDYETFEDRLKKILNISCKNYVSQLSDSPKSLVYYDRNKSTKSKIIQKIKKYIK